MAIENKQPYQYEEHEGIRCAEILLNQGGHRCSPDVESILKQAVSFDRIKRPSASDMLRIFENV